VDFKMLVSEVMQARSIIHVKGLDSF